MAEYNLGTAQGVIKVDYDGTGVTKAKEDLGGLGDKAKATGPSLQQVGKTGSVVGLAVAGGFAVAVKSASDFETRMSAIGAVSGASGAELDSLRQKAMQLGADTAFSAGESAGAIEELIKAGLSVEDVLNGAADATVNLAAAGSVDMVTAATIASNAMNSFGLTAEDMVGVVDNIAGAANASAIDVGEFGQSLQQVGAVANLAGVSFEDTATAIALMGNAGIRGSDAGTSLKTMLQNLQPQTAKQKDLFEELGIVTADGSNRFYDAQGNLKSLSDVAGILNDSLSGMTAQQKQATLEMMFGTDAIRAAAVISEAGAKGFDKMTASMDKVSAADVAAKRMDNFGGSMEQLKGSLETLAISVGGLLLPALQSIADKLTGAVNWFMDLSPSVQNATLAVIGIVGALGLGLGAFAKLARVMQTIGPALGGLGRGFASFGKAVASGVTHLASWGLAAGRAALSTTKAAASVVASGARMAVSAAVTAARVVAGWVLMGVQSMLNAAKMAIAWVIAMGPIALVIAAVIGVVAAIIANWDKVKAVTAAVWNAIVGVVTTVWTTITTFVTGAVNAVKSVVTGVWDAIKTATTAAWNAVKVAITVVWTAIRAYVSGAVTAVKTVVTGVWNAIKSTTSSIWNGVKSVITSVWNAIKSSVTTVVNAVKSVITTVWNAIKTVTTTVWNGIKTAITVVWNAIKSTVTTVVNAVKSVITTVWNAIKSVTSSVWDGIKNVINTVMNGIKSVVTSVAGAVRSALTTAWNAVKSVTTSAWNAMKNTVSGAIDAVIGLVRGIKDKVLGALSGAASWLVDAGKNIIQGLIDGITGMIGNVTDAIGNVVGKIRDFLPGSPVKVGPLQILNRGKAGREIIEMLVSGLNDMQKPLANAVERVVAVPALTTDLARMVPAYTPPLIPSPPSPMLVAASPQPAPVVVSLDAEWKRLADRIDEQTDKLVSEYHRAARDSVTWKRQGAV